MDSLPALNCPSILLLHFQTLCDKICCQKFEIKGILVTVFKIWVISFQRLFLPNQAFPPSPPILQCWGILLWFIFMYKKPNSTLKTGERGELKTKYRFVAYFSWVLTTISSRSVWNQLIVEKLFQVIKYLSNSFQRSTRLKEISHVSLDHFDHADVIWWRHHCNFHMLKRVQIFDIEAFLPHLTSNLQKKWDK